jgi:pimeloyl-ACP methyl ester carboxylesterase
MLLAWLGACSSGETQSETPSAPTSGDTSGLPTSVSPGPVTPTTPSTISPSPNNSTSAPTATSPSSSPTGVEPGGNPPDTSPTDDTSSPGATPEPVSSGTDGSESQPVTDAPTTDVDSGETSDDSGPAVTVLLAGDDVDRNGPLATTVEDVGFSDGGHILVRPTTLTNEPNTKHPVAIWGPGGGTPPRDYLQLLTRMASQGFVIVGIRESTGDAVLMSAAIDWLEEQNANSSSPMYDKLILNRVGVFGHSMGGLSSEATALADKRVSTALLDNSGSFSHDALVNVTVPVGIIYGETGQEKPNAEGDFNNPGNKAPVWLSMMAGGGHGSGPWDGAGANVAWMRWHLGGENSRKDAFLGNGGAYNNTGIWKTQFKNWDGWKNWNE